MNICILYGQFNAFPNHELEGSDIAAIALIYLLIQTGRDTARRVAEGVPHR